MRWTARRERFRSVLTGDDCVHPASVFDPMSARIAEDLGFEAGMLAGSVASMTVLGAPDMILLTLSEFAGQALRISRASELPLLVDADHGYGNALNVTRTVEELEIAGVAALSIEDTDLPQPYGAGAGARLISIDEGVGKMRAALEGRIDASLVIAGRTSATRMTGVDDAAERIRSYEEAGVDAIFLVGVQTREELDKLAEAVDVPLILGGAGADVMDPGYLADLGVRICLQGHQPFAAAVRAVHDTLKALRDGVPPADLADQSSSALLEDLSREDRYRKWTEDFLGKI
ncbi:oxaloacetate decarboxylase [Pseudomonadota bacterium]